MGMNFPGDRDWGSEDCGVSDPAEEELIPIFEVLRSRTSDFKQSTGISWHHIIPAILKFSISLLVQVHGVEAVQRVFEAMARDIDAAGGIPVAAHLEYDKPPLSQQSFVKMVDMLGEIAQQMGAQGHQLEQIAHAFTNFAILVAGRVTDGDPWLAKSIIAQAIRDLEAASGRA
jgi:hypothetical protein